MISADKDFQLNLRNILVPYLEKIEFDEEGKASRFYPNGKSNSVVVDPEIQFGAPVINGSRVSVTNLVEGYEAGDSIESLATIYNLEPKAIAEAIEFAKAA